MVFTSHENTLSRMLALLAAQPQSGCFRASDAFTAGVSPLVFFISIMLRSSGPPSYLDARGGTKSKDIALCYICSVETLAREEATQNNLNFARISFQKNDR